MLRGALAAHLTYPLYALPPRRVVFSLLGDLFPPSRRAGVSSIVQLSTGVGLALGQGIAGFVGAHRAHCWPRLQCVLCMNGACTFQLSCRPCSWVEVALSHRVTARGSRYHPHATMLMRNCPAVFFCSWLAGSPGQKV